MSCRTKETKFRPTCSRWLKGRRTGQARIRVVISAAQHAVSTAENQAASEQAGAKEVGELAMGFAERNIASSFEFARKLLQGKDPNDVMALHAEYVNNQMFMEQGKELARRAAKMAGQDPKH
jgi:hypothetical protein